MQTFGIDIARTGEDRSVVVVLDIEGKTYTAQDIVSWSKADVMESVGRIEALFRKWKPDKLIVDADGIGAGCFDRLRELDYPAIPFHGAMRCDVKDMTGELGFVNLRSYAYWNLRCLLDPANGYTVKLPRNDELIGDLCAPKWHIRSGSLIAVQSKDDIRKTIGRSPDVADALAYAAVDVDRSRFEEAYQIHHGHALNQQLQPEIRPAKDEAQAIEEMLWNGARKNVDIFDLFGGF
jgi:hypothetical protein